MKKLKTSLIVILIVAIGFYTAIRFSDGKYYRLASQNLNQIKEKDLYCTQASDCKIIEMCGNCRPTKIANSSSYDGYQSRENLLCPLTGGIATSCVYALHPECINNQCVIANDLSPNLW